MRCRWCTTLLKTRVVENYIKEKYPDCKINHYIGIAYDEPKRIKDDKYPLVEWKMTEKDCLKFCYDRGFDWAGLYEHFDRLSCWCCPLKNKKELKILYDYYPDLWNKLKEMDSRSCNHKFIRNYSIEQVEERFEKKRKEKMNSTQKL